MTGNPKDQASLQIDAPAERIYEIVTDVTAMGRLSPECTGGKWLDGATGPVVGARFKGTNKRGMIRWSTTNTVVTADAGKEFAFETKDSGICWRYAIAPATEGRGVVVTESRAEFKPRPGVAKFASRFFLGGIEEHDDEVRAGMVATLERLKAVAEAG